MRFARGRLPRGLRLAHAFVVVGLASLLFLSTACDPCFGVVACSTEAYLAVDGQIVETNTGVGAAGVQIDVIRRGGVAVGVDSLSTVTNAEGFWQVQFSPGSPGDLYADVVVRTPDGLSYRVISVRLPSSARGGDANLLPPWVTHPYFPDVGELYARATEQRVLTPSITFTRTGGVDIRGPLVSNGTVQVASDSSGRVPLFLSSAGVFASGLGNVVGTLIVRRSATDSSVIDSLALRSTHLFQDPPRIIRLPLGLVLDYAGQLYSRATGAPIGGIPVVFQRTGGVEVGIPTFTNTTFSSGKFSLSTPPLARGTLNGRIIFLVPPARPETVSVALEVFEGPTGRLYRFAAGAYFPYRGILRAGGRGVENATVSVQRVGGVATVTEVATTQTDADGVFRFPLTPLSLGEVVVDVVITPPTPFGPIVLRGVKLASADRTVEDQLVGTYEATPAASGSRANRVAPRLTP